MLIEKYEEKLRKYGFRDKTEVLKYLAMAVWNKENGIKNSSPVQKIIKRIEVKRHPFLTSLPKISLGIHFSEDEIAKILTLNSYGHLGNLMNAIMEVFTFAEARIIYWLRIEMHNRFVYNMPDSDIISTAVSRKQYIELDQMASCANTTLTGLVRIAIDVILKTEGCIQDGAAIPCDIEDALQGYLQRQGFTLHLFSREKQLCFYVNDNLCFQDIIGLIRKYKIPGTCEFLRRVLLFLLNSKNMQFQYIREESDDEESDYFDDNELYVNNLLSRKDFVRNIYK